MKKDKGKGMKRGEGEEKRDYERKSSGEKGGEESAKEKRGTREERRVGGESEREREGRGASGENRDDLWRP